MILTKMRLKVLLFLGLVGVEFPIFSQKLLKGFVLSDGNVSISQANVYLNNSAISTETNENGYFELIIPVHVRETKVIISRVGFESLETDISNFLETMPTNFTLKTATILPTTIVKAKRSFVTKQRLSIIEKQLIGYSYFSKKCTILNKEDFVILPDSKHAFYYYGKKPILIENKALGYLYTVNIGKSWVNGKQSTWGRPTLQVTELEPADNKEKIQWIENRERAFYATNKGFLASLVSQPTSQRYTTYLASIFRGLPYYSSIQQEVIRGNFSLVKTDTLVSVDNMKEGIYNLTLIKPLLIFLNNEFLQDGYPHFIENKNAYFVLQGPANGLKFDRYGNILSAFAETNIGIWINGQFSHFLPYDYLPESIK